MIEQSLAGVNMSVIASQHQRRVSFVIAIFDLRPRIKQGSDHVAAAKTAGVKEQLLQTIRRRHRHANLPCRFGFEM